MFLVHIITYNMYSLHKVLSLCLVFRRYGIRTRFSLDSSWRRLSPGSFHSPSISKTRKDQDTVGLLVSYTRYIYGVGRDRLRLIFSTIIWVTLGHVVNKGISELSMKAQKSNDSSSRGMKVSFAASESSFAKIVRFGADNKYSVFRI